MRVERLTAVVSAVGLLASSAQADEADLVVRNARVFTLDEAQPWAQAVAVKDGRVSYVGSNAGAKALESQWTRVIDGGGRLLLPGFIDSHNHIMIGSNPNVLSLSGAKDLAEIQERISTFSKERPELSWLEGYGWNYSVMPGKRLPTASDLAGLTGGRPAMLSAYDGHTIWLNQEALDLVGVTAESDDALYGELIRDESGRPTGVVVNATMGQEGSPWEPVMPPADPEGAYLSLKQNLADAARFGITTIVDPQSRLERLPMFDRALREGAVKSWIHLALFHPEDTTAEDIAAFEEARDAYREGRIRVTAIKLYIDDVIEPHSAALFEPYADKPDTRGYTWYDDEDFNRIVTDLDRRGFQLFIHAIGDRGIHTALNALEVARKQNASKKRHQLVHVELLSPPDIPRFRDLNVVACMQPRHLAPDITGQWATAVGPQRSQYAWAHRSLLDAGATLAFSSDWYVAEMDPFVGIYTAVTRKRLDGTGAPWIPEQRISVEEAVEGYTLGGAYANEIDDDRGSIEVGKSADLILVSQDIFSVPADAIKDTRVLLTMVAGEVVYREH